MTDSPRPEKKTTPDPPRCPRCFGRGYCPERRKPSRRNPYAIGFYARTCPRCDGTGTISTN